MTMSSNLCIPPCHWGREDALCPFSEKEREQWVWYVCMKNKHVHHLFTGNQRVASKPNHPLPLRFYTYREGKRQAILWKKRFNRDKRLLWSMAIKELQTDTKGVDFYPGVPFIAHQINFENLCLLFLFGFIKHWGYLALLENDSIWASLLECFESFI